MRRGLVRALGSLLLLCATAAYADTVYLKDGSRLEGRLISLSDKALRVETAFAGELAITRSQLKGIWTQKPRRAELMSGHVVNARFLYEPNTGVQRVAVVGQAQPDWASDDPVSQIKYIAPRVVAAQNESDGQSELASSDALPPEDGDYWSGRAEFSLNGNSGNTDDQSVRTQADVERDTGDTLLSLSASMERQEEDDERTAEEYLGEARYEYGVTRRLFVFGLQKLEKDEFEDIDLRSRTLVGPGYYFAREDRLTLKLRTGVGYQHEAYTDGGESNEAIASAGWDYAQLVGEWLKVTHDFTAYPEMKNPSESYLLESALGVEVPIADSPNWRIRGELEHEYNSNPEPGVEDLDTSYRVGVVRQF